VKFGIKGFNRMSLVDWDGMVAATLYLPSCNFRCPYCHNAPLVLLPDQYGSIPLKEVLPYITEHKDFLDGAVITGGEPCMHSTTPELATELKNAGMRIKIDTNGSFPDMLESLIKEDLVDYVAMDIKAPLDFDSYSKSAGITDRRLIDRVRGSIDLLMDGEIDYEFRTTVVPTPELRRARYHRPRVSQRGSLRPRAARGVSAHARTDVRGVHRQKRVARALPSPDLISTITRPELHDRPI